MDEVLLTAVGDTGYPGDTTSSPNWPGVAPGRSGVNNAFSGKWCDTSAFADLAVKPPVLWLRGDQDQVISDESMFDFGTLGKLEAVPGWPGMEVFPPQPQIAETRAMLDRYPAGGGSVRELCWRAAATAPRSSARPRSASSSWPTSRARPELEAARRRTAWSAPPPDSAADGIRSGTP